jgi:hypothetical protein
MRRDVYSSPEEKDWLCDGVVKKNGYYRCLQVTIGYQELLGRDVRTGARQQDIQITRAKCERDTIPPLDPQHRNNIGK